MTRARLALLSGVATPSKKRTTKHGDPFPTTDLYYPSSLAAEELERLDVDPVAPDEGGDERELVLQRQLLPRPRRHRPQVVEQVGLHLRVRRLQGDSGGRIPWLG